MDGGAARYHRLRNSSSARLTRSGCVQGVLCGPPSTVSVVRSSTKAAIRPAVAAYGRTRSASPWMSRTGTSILLRSSRKSVTHVSTHAYTAYGDAARDMANAASQAWSLTRAPRNVSKSKESSRRALKYAGRSLRISDLVFSKTERSTPCGLSSDLPRYGGMLSMSTALLTRLDPYRARYRTTSPVPVE